MIKRIVKQFIPPIFYKRAIYRRARVLFLGELLKIKERKNKYQLFRDELVKQIKRILEIEKFFSEEKMRSHYVYEPVRNSLEHPDLYITQIRYYRMYQFFKKEYPEIFQPDTRILNVGDADGIFLESIGKKETSLNINQECVEFIKKKEMEVVLGDAEKIGFPDSSFDFVFCFQTLEHCPNPIKVLNELGRVAKKKVFISIPCTEQTNIYNINYWIGLKRSSWGEKEVKNVDCHIFEFSTDDFKNILSYTNLEYERSFVIDYFDNDSFKGRLLNKIYPSYFNFFVLGAK